MVTKQLEHLTEKTSESEPSTSLNENLNRKKFETFFKVCWLHLVSGYHYVATLESARFAGNRLKLELTLRVDIQTEIQQFDTDYTSKVWRPIGKPTGPYTHIFTGCRLDLEKSSERKTVYRSNEGDIIELSAATESCLAVNKLISGE